MTRLLVGSETRLDVVGAEREGDAVQAEILGGVILIVRLSMFSIAAP
jgi:hypothetical protein